VNAADDQTGRLTAIAEAALPSSEIEEPPEPEEPPDQPEPEEIDFVVTKEHRRFTEFADAVRRDRYIGLCYGPPGVGKTLSARHYSQWNEVSHRLTRWRANVAEGRDRPDWHAILYTPTINATPRTIDKEICEISERLALIRAVHPLDVRAAPHASPTSTELLIIDEVDRLRMPALEQLRDHYDRSRLGLILIGMPGIEKRLARYPQLYSRIGFVHAYRTLSAAELVFVLEHHWSKLGLALSADDFTDVEALATVARITGGNFRLVQRLFAQTQRIMAINNLSTVTKEVLETARESLVIGSL
jgi:DNA transposition AAA+ family ATPase